jgi:hypothetical protein
MARRGPELGLPEVDFGFLDGLLPNDAVFGMFAPTNGARYFPTGTLRCSSSAKFSRKVTWFCACCASAPSTGISAAMRLPSGARS